MKVALITDTHFGARGDSQHFADHFKKFYDKLFFPYLKENNIKHMIHLGDIVDRRKYINFASANRMRKDFLEPSEALGIEKHFIIGNHDVPYKNTNKINSMSELYSDTNYRMKIYDKATEITIDGVPILLVPWINEENYKQTMDKVRRTKAHILFGHLELSGFQMYKGSYSDEGLNAEIFSDFDIVCSGHFHHKSSDGNINYLGAPYEITWADFNDDRGFHIFDTATRQLEYIKNPFRMFHKLYYDDSEKTFENIIPNDLDHIKDCVVKVVVINKDHPDWFDQYIDRVEKVGLMELQVVEDHKNMHIQSDESLAHVEDTLSLMRGYVTKLDITDKHKARLETLFRSLYEESLTLEVKA